MNTLLLSVVVAAAPVVPSSTPTTNDTSSAVRVARTLGITGAAIGAGAVTGATLGVAFVLRPCLSLFGPRCSDTSGALIVGASIGASVGLLSSPFLIERLGEGASWRSSMYGMLGGLLAGAALAFAGEMLIMHSGPPAQHAAGMTLLVLGGAAVLAGPTIGTELGRQTEADRKLSAGVTVSERDAHLTVTGRF